jgi:hypothetical protein
VTATPCIAWLSSATKWQLEHIANEQHLPAERVAGELVTEGLRRLGVKPAQVPDLPVVAERRTTRPPLNPEDRAAFQAKNPLPPRERDQIKMAKTRSGETTVEATGAARRSKKLT